MSPASSTIMAHWQFQNDDDDQWRGFSQPVSVSLESAYSQWLKDPERLKRQHPATVLCNQFRYIVNFCNATEVHGEAKREQRLRRISLVEAETAQAVTVDEGLWKEYKEQLEVVRAENERQAEEVREEKEAQRQRLAELEEEVRELRAEIGRLEGELEAARTADSRTLPHLSATPFPGRLVCVTGGYAAMAQESGVPVGSLGRVRALEGTAAAVDFPAVGLYDVQVPCEHLAVAREAEMVSRPGSRVSWREDDGGRSGGVVCDSVDEVTVNVLGADGRKRPRCLQRLDLDEAPREAHEALEVGDLVLRGRGSLPGMVVRAEGDAVSARFREPPPEDSPDGSGGERCLDVCFTSLEADAALRRVDEANFVRPLSAVRFRPDAEGAPRAEGQSEVGLAYAVHADGTAVVDFLGNMGCRCGVELLEVVPHPRTLDHAVLSLLSECLSWHEVSEQHREERRGEALLRLLAALPAAPGPAAEACELVDWPPRTEVFAALAKLVPASARSGYSLQEDLGVGSRNFPSPLLCVERVEQISNAGLQRFYALLRGRLLSEGPRADGQGSEAAAAEEAEEDAVAFGMPPGPSDDEAYLWWGGSWEAAQRICWRGFASEVTAEGAPLRLSASSALADLSSEPDSATGLRCLLLARVLLEGAPPAEDRRFGERTLQKSSHALPLFRVHYRRVEQLQTAQ